jgi:hypothetical protein
MNSKHGACIIIGGLIGLMGYGTLVMNRKLTDLEEQEMTAEAAYDTSFQLRQTEHGRLLKRQRETEGIRDYLKSWEPFFARVDSGDKADRIFDTRVKQGGILALNKSSEATQVKKDSVISQTVLATLVFEDDYKKSLEWMSSFEGEVAASRVASCVITKGQRGDDVKMELAFEFPLLSPISPALPSSLKPTTAP